MAAVASDTITITINDIEVEVPNGELIVESVKRLGLEIPIFCYHSRLKPVGMCRMCLVEIGFKQADGSVRKMPKPQAACTLPASKDMVVFTDTEMVHRDRKGVLEFLLVNHPLDCPICDRGGECPLQNNTLFYGPSTSRFIEAKRHNKKAFALSKYVTLDLERCIQCGRCVRFTEEISGDAELAFRFRGAEMMPATFELRDFTSKFSGNVIEICPVGALTNAEYRFRARPWDLQTKPGVCTVCSNGCAIWFDYRVNKMVRINGRTNEAINEEWTCDRGKFGHETYNDPNRLTVPLIRNGDRLEETDWPTAYAAILERFTNGGGKVAGLSGDGMTNEGLHLMKKLFNGAFKSDNLDYRTTKHLGQSHVETKIADFENKKTIVIFGSNLADDEPILFLRIRKAWFKNGARVIVAHHAETEADSFADKIIRYGVGEELKAVSEVAALVGPDAVIVTTHSFLDTDHGPEAIAALKSTGAQFNCYALGASDMGAQAAGFGQGSGTHEIVNGSLDALWIAGDFDGSKLGGAWWIALEKLPFLVVQACRRSEMSDYASVVLPMAMPMEAAGSFTNVEGTLQEVEQILTPPGEAKPAWRIFSEILLRTGSTKPYFSAEEVRRQFA